MKKILVPTDASEYSRRALETALEFARKFNAEIELLFVMHSPISYDSNFNSYIISPEQIEEVGNHVFEATLNGIDISDVSVIKKKSQAEKPAKGILEEIENEKIDLVIMGSHGYGAVAGSLIGSVSQHVLHKAKCSVLIVK
ncbi:universal stress protein UspA-like protein [Desulfosporosinus acidiphilus SJ4]|uniref:Universal stress protein UspA-like protein n=1 Tax=Desulfosporosinus acidiphilus (strain DSM 22704 / JCM 16185 / SJ4) TaxID=646529 RepID=I4D1Q0_DESAJ|nr:universal stress protein [Desulfosporosinus acidiphilus]AFM39724.1 universal stress protein UspA-like protein [Desulfosporosinus acidiphilus SJ4]